jgi:plastocyanin
MSLLLRSAAVGLLAIWLAACSGGAASGSPVATNQVDLPPSYRFVPANITVPVGTTVTWTNHDNFTHSVKLVDSSENHVIKPGESTTLTFDTAGTFNFLCTFHPQQMKGTVTVTPAS